MSIQELSLKFKAFVRNEDMLLVLIVVGTAVFGFLLGRSSVAMVVVDLPKMNTQSATVQHSVPLPSENEGTGVGIDTNAINSAGQIYVASKSGTKYHLPWCGGAKQIKEENKVFFASKDEAEGAGYTPAANCKGI